MTRDRDEHLEWCKQRARALMKEGDYTQAVTSMLSDLSKHPELKGIGEKMALVGIFYLSKQDHEGVRRFIEGFR